MCCVRWEEEEGPSIVPEIWMSLPNDKPPVHLEIASQRWRPLSKMPCCSDPESTYLRAGTSPPACQVERRVFDDVPRGWSNDEILMSSLTTLSLFCPSPRAQCWSASEKLWYPLSNLWLVWSNYHLRSSMPSSASAESITYIIDWRNGKCNATKNDPVLHSRKISFPLEEPMYVASLGLKCEMKWCKPPLEFDNILTTSLRVAPSGFTRQPKLV